MRKSVIAIIIIVLVVLYMSVFVVKEGERGITLRFGKVLRDDENKPLVYAPGLHFKIPFIESVKMLDARIQTMDNQADRFVTKEKKDLIVDSYIKWRISDFSRYYLATGGGDISQAEVLLKRKFSTVCVLRLVARRKRHRDRFSWSSDSGGARRAELRFSRYR